MSGDATYLFLNGKGTFAALDRTFDGREHTPVYALVYRAKFAPDEAATGTLIDYAMDFLLAFPHFMAIDYVCAIPSTKDYDLPRHLAEGIARKIGKPDITEAFLFEGVKNSARKLSVHQKKRNWKNAGITYIGPSLKNKKVLLLDDNYQSGATMRYIAGLLNNHGLMAIYGLAMTKTWSDTDNLRRMDD